MPIKRSRKGRSHSKAKKVTVDGINFKSGLEKFMYQELKKNKLFEGYENEKFPLIDSFAPCNEFYERQANSKGEFRQRGGKKIQGISYTPDFCGRDFIIECKGFPNQSFPIRWKLFKKHLCDVGDERTVFKPQTQSECSKVIQLILNQRLT